MATARASVADIRPWQLGQPREQLSPPTLSRANVIFLEQLSLSAALPCGRHYFSPHKWLPKIADFRDTAALSFCFEGVKNEIQNTMVYEIEL